MSAVLPRTEMNDPGRNLWIASFPTSYQVSGIAQMPKRKGRNLPSRYVSGVWAQTRTRRPSGLVSRPQSELTPRLRERVRYHLTSDMSRRLQTRSAFGLWRPVCTD